jgi:hypothetical protein
MTRLLAFLILVISVSCNQKKQEDQQAVSPATDSIAVINDPKNNLNIQTNSFSEIDSSGIIMLPLSIAEKSSGSGKIFYKRMPDNSYWNIIFYNSNTKQYHLLTEKKILIQDYNTNYSSGAGSYPISQQNKLIFYSVITDDYNKDKVLDDEDPEYLFVSDTEGNNFRQISPLNHDVTNWKVIDTSKTILMTVRKDTDKNNKFDDKDEVSVFETDITGSVPIEIFSQEFKNNMKILFDRDWKRVKM